MGQQGKVLTVKHLETIPMSIKETNEVRRLVCSMPPIRRSSCCPWTGVASTVTHRRIHPTHPPVERKGAIAFGRLTLVKAGQVG